ncbi:Histidine kinase [Chitinophaga costaii]|uniref:Histidine kinase n=1 Tax=Chitinophaga costaii TaxID=1335309 RepID=A0A1C3YX30_9BACT|nr:histidine kinase [Chitinophaga costaii]PUZ30135.1 sensor histidine kinase [Chitinophaga costaii]SCB74578.1 Histidine kinase [Chitinophaga costaii]
MKSFQKLEFGTATAIFLFSLLTCLSNSVFNNVFEEQHTLGYKFELYHQVFDYYIHYLIPVVLHILVTYGAFLLLNFFIVPKYFERRKWVLGLLCLAPLAVFVFFMLMIADSYYYGYLFGVYKTVKGAHMYFAKMAFNNTLLYAVLYAIYYSIRELYLSYVYPQLSTNMIFRQIISEGIPMAIIWVVLLVFALSRGSHLAGYIVCYGPYLAGCYFLWMHKGFPEYQGKKDRGTFVLTTLLYSLPAAILTMVIIASLGHMQHSWGGVLVALGFVTLLLQFVVLLPLSWRLYQLRKQRKDLVGDLEVALGKSAANLDFLRSQINPHFLFNALNTLYGTALQENATHTSEGIQRLGDMMRFMLHENSQEKIALTKEVAYLHNYISLQRLRTQSSPDIQVDVNMNELHCNMDIAPMLLIPFVENAFKHGISLRSRSRISVSLYCDNGKVFFDVFNSIHSRPENDTEKEGFGIGLNNVKHRLALLYPGHHELSIRQTATEFFVHLTITVNPEKL